MNNIQENISKIEPFSESWGSHLPVLMDIMEKNPNSRFLELGAGYNSTPHIINSTSYSEHYETNFEWFQKMKEFETPEHIINFWGNYTQYEWLNFPAFDKEWDIAFVDNAPGESRQSNLLKLKDKCKFIVCHDTEEVYKPSASNYGWDFSAFKYVFVYDKYHTYTTVVSNYEDFKM